MKEYSGPGLFIVWTLVFVFGSSLFNDAAASECIKCHTDKNKLQGITKNLPQKEKSTETAGQG